MLVLLRSIISFVRNYIQERPTQIFSKLCTVHCGRNVNQPSAPTEFEGKGLQLWWDIAVQQKTSYYIKLERILMIFGFLVNIENTIEIYSYSTPWALFPQKGCVAPEFFVLISSQCSTQIWRIRYGGSWSIYFLVESNFCLIDGEN